ncbi:endonuclease NucS domain-containing protein [Thermogladius sp. 4427co]|uniref:endonuclease NucS domain-containing protein n=1 Tax=Thermogladius sp. 4427co TaxID=3450718 RepID=UPI003F791ABD
MERLIKSLQNPDAKTVLNEVLNAWRNKELFILIGEFEVEYEGRGYSRLSNGERILLVKSDGAVLVHSSQGFKPINYQPSSDVFEAWLEPDGRLSMLFVRDNPREVLKLVFNSVTLLIRGRLVDKGVFTMYFDESELRDFIFNHPEVVEKGLEVIGREVKVSAGTVDILARDVSGRLVVIEVKRSTATRESAIQLYRYVLSIEYERGVKPRGLLVAPSFTPSAIDFMRRNGLEWRYVDPKKVLEYLKGGKIGRPLG